jgi:hypothetical protein
MFKSKFKKVTSKAKEWVLDNRSQQSSETGVLTIGSLLLAAGVMTLSFPKVKEAFGNIMGRFTGITSNGSATGNATDPFTSGAVGWQ